MGYSYYNLHIPSLCAVLDLDEHKGEYKGDATLCIKGTLPFVFIFPDLSWASL
jgi:hypothetical protein